MVSIKSFLVTAAAVFAATAFAEANNTTGEKGDATVVNDAYIATLPNSVKTAIRGSVVAMSAPDGSGVNFQVSMSGFPAEGGPFLYHIHVNAVPEDGNCSAALGHLNPFGAGEACDSKTPAACQVGDLSGKHGKIQGPGFSDNYVDKYVSINPSDDAFFGNRSIVIHYANKTIITCANFLPLAETTDNCTTASYVAPKTSATASSGISGNATGSGIMTPATGIQTAGSSAGASASASDSTAPAASTGGATAALVNGRILALGVLAFML